MGLNTKQLSLVQLDNEQFYKIANSDELRPFFMSIVSYSNHWMFISSNGGLTAGRKNAQYSLFPYYTDDKITEAAEITGSKSIFQVKVEDKTQIWEPFSIRSEGRYNITRNLYKNVYGNKVVFEEENHDLKLTFRYQWNSSDTYGFVKKSTLVNHADTSTEVTVLDGLQNLLPASVNSDLQNASSNLVDAYKKCELEKDAGLGIYSLSAIIVDKAEPSESLKANIVWSLGLKKPKHLLSSLQLRNFRRGQEITEEIDMKAEKGAYFVNETLTIGAGAQQEWMIVADLNKNHAAVAAISNEIKNKANLVEVVQADIDNGTERLISLNAGADGLQLTSDKQRDTRHFANTLFNIMRGGIFDNNYQIERKDFAIYLSKANKAIYQKFSDKIQELAEEFTLADLRKLTNATEDANFKRLCYEYMPLKFSRRHGDPSRPWNKFSINTRSEVDGSKILDYQGNWRDIFQNWEALAHSYPEFIDSMIHKFLNATTADGYNPYRVTKDGFDWEAIEADDPWSYIGYWGDHQIIYLLKFLEFIEKHQPGQLASYYNKNLFVYANVPYRIKSYVEILENSKDTIDFDHAADTAIRAKREEMGADGALLQDKTGAIYRVNFIEKILATTLAKLSNFILEGGIWMNTQRPEWNDANNALVGNGVSMVTLYYLRRFFHFFEGILADTNLKNVEISEEILAFYNGIHQSLEKHQGLLSGNISDAERKLVLEDLGEAGGTYRSQIYQEGFAGKKAKVSFDSLRDFVKVGLKYMDHTIDANKRADNLYHAYNLMTNEENNAVSVSYLSEMLEGQVAVLSSGYLSSKETLSVLDGLKSSALFREDQYSYILYPNKNLPRFVSKNTVPTEAVQSTELFAKLAADGNVSVIEKDLDGVYHFNGNFKNANDLKTALDALAGTEYADLAKQDRKKALQVFEKVFNHKAFTGRSGTFFGYEGLGSIYWHMVSKLQLAVQECCLNAVAQEAGEVTVGKLMEHYYEISAGVGVHKSPTLYGAFPTDPYSHTPAGKGAQQPGMTGQVKEDLLSRFGELGVRLQNGQLFFKPTLLKQNEFLPAPATFRYVDVNGVTQEAELAAGLLAFTYCQVPVVYAVGEMPRLLVQFADGHNEERPAFKLTEQDSREVFGRTGKIAKIYVTHPASVLK